MIKMSSSYPCEGWAGEKRGWQWRNSSTVGDLMCKGELTPNVCIIDSYLIWLKLGASDWVARCLRRSNWRDFEKPGQQFQISFIEEFRIYVEYFVKRNDIIKFEGIKYISYCIVQNIVTIK